MTPEFKAKWIAALRSGEYQQTRRKLKDEHGFCCLGVAAEITQKPGWVAGDIDTWGKIQEITGLSTVRISYLISMNDGHAEFWNNEQSFSQIADYLETVETT